MEKSDKEKAQELFEKGIDAYDNEKHEEAKKFFEEAIILDKKKVGAYYNLGIYYRYNLTDKDNEKALKYFEKTIELSPNFTEAYFNLALLYHLEYKDFEKTKFFYEKTIASNPNFENAYKNLSLLLSQEFNDTEKAKKYFEKYRELSKTNENDFVKKNGKIIESINSIFIQNYFSLKEIKVENLIKKKEVYFLGENGDGKTILLQSILLSLKQSFLKDYGDKTLISEALQYLSLNNTFNFKAFDNLKNEYDAFDLNFAKNIFAYGVNRSRKEEEREDKYGFMTLFSTRIELNNPVDWLKNLDYFESKEGYDSPFPLKTAIEILKSILDNNVEIDVSPRGVVFTEKGTRLEFEQLSDGYKSVLIWVSDLIVKLADSQPNAKRTEDFKGVVLVDEIDLHLHPKWAYSIMTKLRGWFPKIQWFITTHSHDVIRGAGEDAVFYRLYKEYSEEHQQNIVKISEPYDVKEFENAMSNVVATSPLFDLSHARMKTYKNGNLETDDDYYYAKIHRQVRADIEQMKKEGKINIPKKEIDNLIKKAIEKYSSR
ncbi:MAG: AAA family ATPase [Bacteroidales bacterium]|nr:AAA family ATPase [Bacteroidales bacterium]